MLREFRPKPQRRKRRGPPISKSAAWILGIVLIGLLVVAGQAMYRHDALTKWRQSLNEGGRRVEWPQWNPAWPPLPRPTTKFRHRIVASDLSGPYAYAALNKDLVSSMPCYCGCRRIAHESNLSCFVRDFTATGMPIWTDHAFTCPICVNIISDVSLLKRLGLSAVAIREAIDEHYGGWFRWPTRTPTPPRPVNGGTSGGQAEPSAGHTDETRPENPHPASLSPQAKTITHSNAARVSAAMHAHH